MSDITLQQRMTDVRSKCEEFFYMVSPYTSTKEDAEKFAQIAAMNHYQDMIRLHEEVIRTAKVGEEYSNFGIGRNYVNGIRAANGARVKTHEGYIDDLKKYIEIIKANIL